MERNRVYAGSMTRAAKPRKRLRGDIETLPSGALRVVVYAGIDPISKKRHYLTEVVPANAPNPAKLAEEARSRILAQVDQKRSPKTRATVNQLLERHLELLDVESTTLDGYESLMRNHIRPFDLAEPIPTTPPDPQPPSPEQAAAIVNGCIRGARGIKHP